MTETLDLWTERGIPIQEIVNQITTREDADCATAYDWLSIVPEVADSDLFESMSKFALDGTPTRKVWEICKLSLCTTTPDTALEITALAMEHIYRQHAR